jgi:uncharacterized protein
LTREPKEIDIRRLRAATWRRAKQVVRLRLFDLKDGSTWSLTAAIIAGKKSGPIVSVVAGQHGNEWNGSYIAHRLFQDIEPEDLTGTLILLPVANPFAFLHQSRLSLIDQVDMNRVHGFREQQPTMQAASLLFEHIFRPSGYVLDLHSGGQGTYLPNVGIIEQGRLAQGLFFNTGTVVVVSRSHGTLAAYCERQGIPAFALQLGTSSSIDYGGCETMSAGIINFLRGVGLIDEPPVAGGDQQLFLEKKIVPAPESGFIKLAVEPGRMIGAGQTLGFLEPLFGAATELASPDSGKIIYLRREQLVGRGETVAHLAVKPPA